MSLTNVMPYFRTHLNALGYKEWKDALNYDNIPKSIRNKSYHIEVNPTTGVVLNQHVQEMNSNVSIRLFVKGFRNTTDRLETGLLYVEGIIKRLCDPDNRVTGIIKNVYFNSMNIVPLDVTNDNSFIFEINFTALYYIDVDE